MFGFWQSGSRRGRAMVVAVAVAAAAAILGALLLRAADEDTVTFSGMEMSTAELDAMVRESMGVSSMEKLPLVRPGDRTAELTGTLRGGVREFQLEARPLRWEYRSRQSIAAWGYEGQVPGPALRMREGERVRVEVTNNLPVPTTVHWHGVDVPFLADGVPGVTQEPIEPGDTFAYEFTARPAGTRFYHTHGAEMRNEAQQLDMGLAGPLLIEPTPNRPVRTTPPDVDEVLVLDEWQVEQDGLNGAMMIGAGHAAHQAGFNLFTINGRAAPDTAAIKVKRGDRVRIRFINAGSSTTHPMHLHGHNFTVVAADGNPVPAAARQRRNVIAVAPGETYDVTFTADNPGVWMLHCHELHHADAGMMTLLQYDGFEPVGAEHGKAADHGSAAEGDGDQDH